MNTNVILNRVDHLSNTVYLLLIVDEHFNKINLNLSTPPFSLSCLNITKNCTHTFNFFIILLLRENVRSHIIQSTNAIQNQLVSIHCISTFSLNKPCHSHYFSSKHTLCTSSLRQSCAHPLPVIIRRTVRKYKQSFGPDMSGFHLAVCSLVGAGTGYEV